MEPQSILALVILIILVIIIVVALAYHPAAALNVKKETCLDDHKSLTAKEILAKKVAGKQTPQPVSNMTPPMRNQLSPLSTGSESNNLWDQIEKIRLERKLNTSK